MRSITKQVLTTVLVAQVTLAIGIISLLWLHERYTRLHDLDSRLQGRADSLAGAIQDAEDAAANVYVDPQEFQTPAGDSFSVYGEDGRRIATSSHDDEGLTARTGSQGLWNRRSRGELYRVKEQAGVRIIDRAETQGAGIRRPITIVYATPEAWVQRELAEATRFYILAGALTTAIVAVLLTWSLRSSLRPISELAAAAAAIGAPPVLRFTPPASVVQVQELSVLARSLDAVVKRVQKAFEKEQQFLSDAAHELKTAVTVVHSGLQVLLIRTRDANEYVAGIERALLDTSRLEALIRQMLQASDVAENSSEAAQTDLYTAAQAAVWNVAPVSELRRVSVLLVGQSGSIVGLTSARATLLVENLVSNALQHSSAATQVVVELQQSAKELTLLITDRGEGIRPEALPHVFERFYREDASRSRSTGGTGLGLAICKAIADSAGARISLESRLAEGTTARVIFPARLH